MSSTGSAGQFLELSEVVGVSRLRSKFSDQLALSAEWPLFEYVTRDIEVQSTEFRKLAQDIASADSLDAFINSYRELYGKAAELAPDKAAEKAGAPSA